MLPFLSLIILFVAFYIFIPLIVSSVLLLNVDARRNALETALPTLSCVDSGLVALATELPTLTLTGTGLEADTTVSFILNSVGKGAVRLYAAGADTEFNTDVSS